MSSWGLIARIKRICGLVSYQMRIEVPVEEYTDCSTNEGQFARTLATLLRVTGTRSYPRCQRCGSEQVVTPEATRLNRRLKQALAEQQLVSLSQRW